MYAPVIAMGKFLLIWVAFTSLGLICKMGLIKESA